MNISWVVADDTFLDPDIDIERLKQIGSIWGGWKTWRSCQTDNVICSDVGRARELIQRNFNNICNFFVPKDAFVELDRPTGVQLFDGKFTFEIDHPDELISLHLASSRSDIVLLLGFDLQPKDKKPDRLEEHRAQNYRTGIKHAIKDNIETQWVLVNHVDALITELNGLENLTQDTLANVLELLG